MNTMKTKFIAHRGYSEIATENTIDAFNKAASEPYFYGIECDIQVTKDGKFVVFHDDSTKRLSKINLLVKETSFEELREVKLINKLTKRVDSELIIPLFSEYLDICIKSSKLAVVELKNVFSKQEIARLYDLLKKSNYLDNIILISFHLSNLVLLRNWDESLKLQYLVKYFNNDLIIISKNFKLDLNFHKRVPNLEIINTLHRNNIQVNTYTVNKKSKKQSLVAMNIDYITTDNTN